MGEVCPTCGGSFNRIGLHWSTGSCDHPEITELQKEVLTGLLMGDGCCIKPKRGYPRFRVNMITEEYLDYLDQMFGVLSTGVRVEKTGERSARENRETGFSPSAVDDEYSDIYTWRTRSHPTLIEFSNWYSSGEKVFPSDIELTSNVLKHWFVCDGYFNNNCGNRYISIRMDNESGNKEKIYSYFRNVGLPEPNRWENGYPSWSVGASEELYDYMGKPPSGFEYKWPEEYK